METYLRLDSDSYIKVSPYDHFDVHGELVEDRRKASALSCRTAGTSSHSGNEIRTTYHVEIMPGIVLVGDHHISFADKVITKVKFLVDDAIQLFYDHRILGVVIDPKPFIADIANANAEFVAKQNETAVKERVETGDEAAIVYHSGKREIFGVETVLGRVTAENLRSAPFLASQEGVFIRNFIYISIAFLEPVDVQEATRRAVTMIRFLELCAGRPQNLMDFRLETTVKAQSPLEVYWPRRPSRRTEGEIRDKPSPGEILLDAIRRHEEYVRVLPQWLARHGDWEEARMHFITCLHDQRTFGPARITAAANMFDLVPPSGLPPVPQGKRHNTLKENISHRAKIVTDNAGADRFPELDLVISEAVKCRKRYVHARQGTIEYKDHFEIVVFLTRTLEFLFATSDLIECGWDLKNWLDSKVGGDHPFSEFVYGYQRDLGALKYVIANNKFSSTNPKESEV